MVLPMLRLFRQDAPRVLDSSHLELTHDGETLRVALKRVATARRFTLRVRAATRDVVLTMPKRGSLSAARDFAQRNAAWIGARLERLPRPIPFCDGSVIPLRGVDHVVTHRPGMRGTVWIEAIAPGSCADDVLLALCVAGEREHVERRVADYLRKEARRDLEAAVKHYTLAIDLPARRVGLRDTTSRWGSCSSSGSLNFSWRLILAPSHVLDYLAAHEVAHLRHLDHSDQFWALTHRLSPDVDRAEAWLKAHGASLHRYGATADED